MNSPMRMTALLVAVCLTAPSIARAVGDIAGFIDVDSPSIASKGLSDTAKVKVLRMPDGALIIVYAEAQDVGQYVYDIRSLTTRDPRDIVLQYSLDQGDTWSNPINIDGTAAQSSHLGIVDPGVRPTIYRQDHPYQSYIDIESDPRAVPYPGDSGKPQAFNVGTSIVISWSSKYCPPDETRWPEQDQRLIGYPDVGWITNPYSCLWVARLKWSSSSSYFAPIGADGGIVIREQLTSGFRDAHSYVHHPQKPGVGLAWQEDPMGLQTGLAEGPGPGASGALTTGGTDLWYSALPLGGTDIAASAWSIPARLTDNVELIRPLADVDRIAHEPDLYEYGQAAVSRPNIKLVGSRAIVTWEERKVETQDDGKYVRYHTWGDFKNTGAFPMHGCIISHPLENARRVRILTQSPSAGATNIVFLWKQGLLTQAGPSDIMMRRAVLGFDPENITPSIDVERCRAHVKYEDDDSVGEDEDLDSPQEDMRIGTLHQPAVNLSGSTTPYAWPGRTHWATTEANNIEDAQAHRGQIKGDKVIVGYSHTPDQLAFTTLAESVPYNFYVTASTNGGVSWSTPHNFSGLRAENGVSVREPRIVGASGSGPGCPDDPTDCQNKNVFLIGFGTQTNVNADELPVDRDLYMGLTVDAGRSFSRPQPITAGDVINGEPDAVADRETQLKVRPDGNEAYVVWSTESITTKDVAYVVLQRDGIFGCSFEE